MTRVRGGLPKPAKDPMLSREHFIRAAPGKRAFPWEEPGDDDLMVLLNTRQRWRLMEKVDWLAREKEITKRELIERYLLAGVEADLAAHGIKN